MANNIQIVGQILTQQQVSRYSETDLNLLNPLLLREDFGQPNDYIEYFVYDIVGNPLYANYSYKNFKSPTGSFVTPTGSLPIIEIDPVKDLQTLGYQSGEFKVQYNFFNNKISDAQQAGLFLKEISADRTELRLGSTTLTNEQIETGSLALINEISSSLYAVNYIADFGSNNQATVVNVALNKVESGYEVLLKLYEPLATNITEKSTLWIVEEKINPYVFDINLDKLITIPPGPQLRGPNFSIDIPNQNNVATSYQNLDTLVRDFQSVSTASYQQLLSIITSQSIDINTDYSDFTDEEGDEMLEKLNGETIDEEWELVDSREYDENNEDIDIWANKKIKNKENLFTQLADFIKSNPNDKSRLDKSFYKIRYEYSQKYSSGKSRKFCVNMMSRTSKGVVYRKEDIDQASFQGVNNSFGHKGQNYSLFKHKGGVNCGHFWSENLYRLKSKTEKYISKGEEVNNIPSSYKPKGDEYTEAKIAPKDMPNNGHHPNYNK